MERQIGYLDQSQKNKFALIRIGYLMTPSQKIKKLFKEAKKTDKSTQAMSLKEFAESISKGEPLVKIWLSNKSGLHQKKAQELRLKNRGATIRATALATKQARQKRSAGNKAASTVK